MPYIQFLGAAGIVTGSNHLPFIGFQAPGTRGAIIKSGASEVKIFGHFIPIRAQIAAVINRQSA